jgi:hypothetical protein
VRERGYAGKVDEEGQVKTFGWHLRESLKRDEVFPLFHLGEYKYSRRWGDPDHACHFDPHAFYASIDLKVDWLLDHIAQCPGVLDRKFVWSHYLLSTLCSLLLSVEGYHYG